LVEKTVTVQNKLGLHARAASLFVQTSQGFASSITVTSEAATADGKSILKMMLLQAGKGTEIKLKIDGDDEDEAMAALLDLIATKFGEEE